MIKLSVIKGGKSYVEYLPDLLTQESIHAYVRTHYGTECLYDSEQVDNKDTEIKRG